MPYLQQKLQAPSIVLLCLVLTGRFRCRWRCAQQSPPNLTTRLGTVPKTFSNSAVVMRWHCLIRRMQLVTHSKHPGTSRLPLVRIDFAPRPGKPGIHFEIESSKTGGGGKAKPAEKAEKATNGKAVPKAAAKATSQLLLQRHCATPPHPFQQSRSG